MEIKLNIGYKELLQLIKKLPENQLAMLKAELMDGKIAEEKTKRISSFQEFLLKGPVMSDDQYEQFMLNRTYFNSWRKS